MLGFAVLIVSNTQYNKADFNPKKAGHISYKPYKKRRSGKAPAGVWCVFYSNVCTWQNTACTLVLIV